MKHRFWIYLLVSVVVSFGPVWLFDPLSAIGFQDLGGLLVMGALVIGWPGFAVWLGCQAGKDIRRLWPLLLLYSAMMVAVFPYYGGFPLSLGYAAVVLVMGLISMALNRLVRK